MSNLRALPTHISSLAVVSCLWGAGAACDDATTDVCESDPSSEPSPVNPTPPLPDDACANPPTPASMMFESQGAAAADQAAATAAELLDPNAMTIVTCGTGSPIPSDRAQACTAVFAGGQFLLFDAGDGAQASMEDLDLPVVDLTAVFLTHFHSDHMADLGEVISRSWILGRQDLLPVYGGPTVERVVEGFSLIYGADEVYRRAHHGADVFPPSAPLPAEVHRIDEVTAEGTVVYARGGLTVRAYAVDHSPVSPALGYRVEFGGRAVAISGDTIDTPGLRALAAGADVLVSEVMDRGLILDAACAFDRLNDPRNAKLLRDIRTYHVGVDAVGQVAAQAGVGTLVLTHQVPAVPAAQAELLFGGAISSSFDGEVVVAEDGSRIRVMLP